MKNLDETKVYYLRDLSDEQKKELLHQLRCLEINYGWISFEDNVKCLSFNEEWIESNNLHEVRTDLDNIHPISNALTLLEKDNNQRIIEIQLRIQELNSEILELDYELRELTYAKK